MARITTRDCERVVPNRFELVLLAAERAREIHDGATALVEGQREAPTLTALREIATGRLSPDRLRENLVRRLLGLSANSETGITTTARAEAGTNDGTEGPNGRWEAVEHPAAQANAHAAAVRRSQDFLAALAVERNVNRSSLADVQEL
jgi:DNA-directed RNA polymerase omega subunit